MIFKKFKYKGYNDGSVKLLYNIKLYINKLNILKVNINKVFELL